ncbi:MAG: oligosaccharide repeat unit polymerase [Candidatus Nanosynbacter sp.]|nr:oligosaccharide repeat unit polymerase [Candidatus Nanosynbacter sp.]
MLIFYLLALLVLILIINLRINNRIIHPSNILLIVYIFSIYLATLNVGNWKIQLHQNTFILVFLGLISFILGSQIPTIVIRLKGGKTKIRTEYKYYEVNRYLRIFMFLFQIVTCIIAFHFVSKVVGGVSLTNFSAAMEKYRQMSAYDVETVSLPGYLTQMIKISNILIYFIAYIFFENYFYIKEHKEYKRNNIKRLFIATILMQAFLSIITAGRFALIQQIIGVYVLYSIISNQNSDNINRINPKRILVVILGGFVMLAAFSGMRGIVGRTNESDSFDYISAYIGGSVPLLDKAINRNIVDRDLGFGYNTFFPFYRLLHKLSIVNSHRKGNLEFMQSGKLNGNVYTSLYIFYLDFGIVGAVIMQFISGLIWSIIWYILYNRNDFRKRKIFLMLLYCLHINSIALHFYSEGFYSAIIAPSFVLEVIYIYILYKITFEVKLRYFHEKV